MTLCPCGRTELQPMRQAPLGTNACECCGAISPLYEPFATCRDCRDEFCESCSRDPREGEQGVVSVLCHPCATEELPVGGREGAVNKCA